MDTVFLLDAKAEERDAIRSFVQAVNPLAAVFQVGRYLLSTVFFLEEDFRIGRCRNFLKIRWCKNGPNAR